MRMAEMWDKGEGGGHVATVRVPPLHYIQRQQTGKHVKVTTQR